MSTRRTLSSLAFPNDASNPDLPVEWARGVAIQILRWILASFDRMKTGCLSQIDFGLHLDQLERSLTQLHYVELQLVMREQTQGYCSFVAIHECDEFESLKSAKAKPPAHDFGFVHVEHRRWIWPIEAKVLPSPSDLSEYLKDVREKFETGIAAPLTGEGAMLGYLLSGDSEAVFVHLHDRLSIEMLVVPEFADRPHRMTMHARSGFPLLRLHHLLMSCRS